MIRAILTDIEGTTSSLSFVKDVLFPFARAELPEFVRRRGEEPAVAQVLEQARAEAGGLQGEALIGELLRWIDQDRKVTPLKTLQGMIWEAGYRDGRLHGHVYEDAVRNLRAWKAQGLALYVFSSGSVQAQKLLFAHTRWGDLTPLFSDYFDTTVGAKKSAAAYAAIAARTGRAPGDMLFLSDVREELDAAREAGLRTAWLVREAVPDPRAVHPQVRDFDALAPLVETGRAPG